MHPVERALEDLQTGQCLHWTALSDRRYKTPQGHLLLVEMRDPDAPVVFLYYGATLIAYVPYHGGDILETLHKACAQETQKQILLTEQKLQRVLLEHGVPGGSYVCSGGVIFTPLGQIPLPAELAQTVAELEHFAGIYTPQAKGFAVFCFYEGDVSIPLAAHERLQLLDALSTL